MTNLKVLYPYTQSRLESNPYPLMVTQLTEVETYDTYYGYTFIIIGKDLMPNINTDLFYSASVEILIDRVKHNHRLVEYDNMVDAIKGIEEHYLIMDHHTEVNRLMQEMLIPCLDDGLREEIELEYHYQEYLQEQEYERQARLNGREENRNT